MCFVRRFFLSNDRPVSEGILLIGPSDKASSIGAKAPSCFTSSLHYRNRVPSEGWFLPPNGSELVIKISSRERKEEEGVSSDKKK